MAKVKAKTTKKAAPKKVVADVEGELTHTTTIGSDGFTGVSVTSEKKGPDFTEQDLDVEVKDILKQLGAVQSKYRQIKSDGKAKILRGLIRSVRLTKKVWK